MTSNCSLDHTTPGQRPAPMPAAGSGPKMARFLATVCLTVLWLGPSAPVPATMYKWVDANGQTHYGSRPPPGQPTKTVKPPPRVDTEAALKRLREREEAFAKRSKNADEKASKEKETAAVAEARQANCQLARKKLQSLQSGNQMFKLDAQGNKQRIDEPGRQALLAETQGKIEEYCR